MGYKVKDLHEHSMKSSCVHEYVEKHGLCN